MSSSLGKIVRCIRQSLFQQPMKRRPLHGPFLWLQPKDFLPDIAAELGRKRIPPLLLPCIGMLANFLSSATSLDAAGAVVEESSRAEDKGSNGERAKDKNNGDNIDYLLTLAKISIQDGNYDRAEAMLNMGVRMCEEKRNFTALPLLFDVLVAIAFERGDVVKAESIIVHAIEKLIQHSFKENDNSIIDLKLRLSRLHSYQGNYAMAEIGFDSCLDAVKTKLLRGDVSHRSGMLYISILFWFGVHKIRTNAFQEANVYINDAYAFSGKIRGLTANQEMAILQTLAELNYEMGQYDMALKSLHTAIAIGKGVNSYDLPSCYCKLGRIYLKLNVLQLAKTSYEEASKLSRGMAAIEIRQEAITALAEIKRREKNSP